MIQVAVTVDNVPVVSTPAVEAAAGGIGRYSGADTTYQTVKSWTVATGKTGELKEISMTSTVLAKTHWKIVIGAVTFVTDLLLGAPVSFPFFDLKLAAGVVVTVSCKSTDGSSINADASIVGKEIG
jgi:hypothetical protein